LAPHLLLYAGVSGGLAAALIGVRLGSAVGPVWRVGRHTLPLGYTLALAGNAGVVLTAPVDDLWHRLYGRDVDIWSPPHLAAIAGTGLSTVGWTILALRASCSGRLLPRLAAGTFFGFLLYTGWFALNWYQMLASTRDVLAYPALVCLLLLPVLVAAAQVGPSTWSATAAAAVFLLLAAEPVLSLSAIHWTPPALPPLLLVPAALVDLARGRAIAQGLLFAAAFVALEWLRVALVGPGPGPAPVEAGVVAPHLAAAAERAWSLPNIAAAAPVVFAAGIAGALLGSYLGRQMARLAGRTVLPERITVAISRLGWRR
jgi:hypothetical protein